VNDQDTTEARAKLLATITPDLTALLEVDGTRDTSSTGYYSPVYPIIGGTLAKPIYGTANKNDSYASQEPRNNSWDGGVSLRVVYNINPNLTFKSISAYRGFAQQPVNYNNDGQPLVEYNGTAASLSTPFPPLVSISDNFIDYRDQELTQEFQLLGNYDKFNYVSGLYFLHENFASNRIGYVVSPAGAGTPAFPRIRLPIRKPPIMPLTPREIIFYRQADRDDWRPLHDRKSRLPVPGRYDNFQGAPLVLYPDPTTPGEIAANKSLTLNFTNAGEPRNRPGTIFRRNMAFPISRRRISTATRRSPAASMPAASTTAPAAAPRIAV